MKFRNIVIFVAQIVFVAASVNNGGRNVLESLNTGSEVRRVGRSVLDKFPINESLYDSELPPPQINGTGIPVKISVVIYGVRGVKEVESELTMEIRLQILWPDTRLESWKSMIPEGKKFIAVPRTIDKKLWHPDLYIDFIKEIIQPPMLGNIPMSLRYYTNGDFRISTRLTLRMACPMQFHYYPVDKQRCSVVMKSYAFPEDVLAVQWNYAKPNTLTLWKKTELPNFYVNIEKPKSDVVETRSANQYTSIMFTVLLQRKLSYHFIQTYIPSTLFVVISWLSFLVPPESVPGRTALCMTTLLSQTTMFSAIRQNIPKVSYPKALDIWMVACIFFVFLTLLEYTIILKLKSLVPGEDERLRAAGVDLNDKSRRVPLNKYAHAVNQCEKFTWMAIIGLFTIFNWVYWPWLVVSAGFFDKLGDDLYYINEESVKSNSTIGVGLI